MRKIILMLILAFVSSNAMAEWVRIDGDEASVIYSDPSRIIRDGNLVKMWSLTNYKAPQSFANGTYRSELSQDEFDCKEMQVRNLFHSFHSEAMGRGNEMLPESYVGKWFPVEPNSLNESTLKLACGQK